MKEKRNETERVVRQKRKRKKLRKESGAEMNDRSETDKETSRRRKETYNGKEKDISRGERDRR